MSEKRKPTGVQKAARTTFNVLMTINIIVGLLLVIGMIALVIWLKSNHRHPRVRAEPVGLGPHEDTTNEQT